MILEGVKVNETHIEFLYEGIRCVLDIMGEKYILSSEDPKLSDELNEQMYNLFDFLSIRLLSVSYIELDVKRKVIAKLRDFRFASLF